MLIRFVVDEARATSIEYGLNIALVGMSSSRGYS